jgi:phosphatidylglycerol:prolipoprotein diacylglycerol transferase
MHPTLFTAFGVAVPTYAVTMVGGYLLALAVVWFLTPRTSGEEVPPGGLDRAQVVDLFIVLLIASLVGAKLGHVVFGAEGHVLADGTRVTSVWELLREDPWHPLRLGEGGYVWYGGMLGALGAAAVYFWRRPHLNGLLYADVFAPAVMMGAFLGRVGCFMSGCCYGKPTDLPWGVVFPATHGQAVHPTQIYDAGVGLLSGLFLMVWLGRRRFDGQSLGLLLMIYPVARYLTEMLRGDPGRGTIGPFSTSQAISLGLGLVGIGFYAWARRRGKLTPVGGRGESAAADVASAQPDPGLP